MNAMPTKDNLVRRKIIQDASCSLCSGGVETIEHVLRDCTMAASIWFSSPLSFRVHEARNIAWVDWIASLAPSLARDSFDLVLMSIWHIWKERNALMWQGSTRHPLDINYNAQAWLVEY